MILNILTFIGALSLVAWGATLATKYSAEIAKRFNFSRYAIGFIVVAFICILPETVIAISSALKGMPEFGIATLFGSNIADLTLIFAIITIVAGRGLKIESRMLKDARYYLSIMMIPILFGLNGHYSRLEGVALIVAGLLFYRQVFKTGASSSKAYHSGEGNIKNILFLLIAMAMLLIGAHFTVDSASQIANVLLISPIIIGMLIVSLGTTLPELFYSLKAVRKKEDELAVGDILGIVLADATIVVGLVAIIAPFFLPIRIIYITGMFMIVATFFLLRFMKTERILTRFEGLLLLLYWIIYAVVEFLISK